MGGVFKPITSFRKRVHACINIGSRHFEHSRERFTIQSVIFSACHGWHLSAFQMCRSLKFVRKMVLIWFLCSCTWENHADEWTRSGIPVFLGLPTWCFKEIGSTTPSGITLCRSTLSLLTTIGVSLKIRVIPSGIRRGTLTVAIKCCQKVDRRPPSPVCVQAMGVIKWVRRADPSASAETCSITCRLSVRVILPPYETAAIAQAPLLRFVVSASLSISIASGALMVQNIRHCSHVRTDRWDKRKLYPMSAPLLERRAKNGTYSVPANVPPGRRKNRLKNWISRWKGDRWQP